jgi:hypothetical protein
MRKICSKDWTNLEQKIIPRTKNSKRLFTLLSRNMSVVLNAENLVVGDEEQVRYQLLYPCILQPIAI